MTNHRSSTTSLADEPIGSMESQQHPLAETGQEVGESVGHLAERAADIGFQRADDGKSQVALGIDQLAGSIRRVSTDMESEQPSIASAAMTAADQAERLAGYLRTTDSRQILRAVEDVARRQPILFLGGAFIAGLAASRFLKAAGGPDTRGARAWGASTYGDGYSSGYRSGGTASYRPTGPGGTVMGGGVANRTTVDEGL
jgi:hypothetical protein